jgi:hypothetical protein
MVTIKGFEINVPKLTDSHDRRATQSKNKILQELKQLEIPEEQVVITLPRFAFQKTLAAATWYFQGHRLYYSYNLANNFAENIAVVHKVIALHVQALITKNIPLSKFVSEFQEEDDVEEERKKAREMLGLEINEKDMAIIDKRFKDLAKKHHPDSPEGNTDTFKEINKAHKILKRELQ